MKKILFFLFAFFSIGVGLYPILFVAMDMKFGLLNTKPEPLFQNPIWRTGFYAHVVFGGIALMAGWSQFSSKLRAKRLHLHRILGKIYVLAVLASGLAALTILKHVTGDWITQLGFGLLAIGWLGTTALAYFTIKNGKVLEHEKWMIYSFAFCWAAVTLRLLLPFSQFALHMPFEDAYRIIAWLSWVPNVAVAFFLAKR